MSLDNALPKLAALEDRYEMLNAQMMDPGVTSDIKLYQQISKSWSDLKPLVEVFRNYKTVLSEIESSEELLSDNEMKELASADLDELRPRKEALEAELKIMLLPKDPNDDKNVIIEIRPAAGGEEAALFAGDLLRMYTRYSERRNWKVELLNSQETGIGGYSDAVIGVQGQGAYSQLKFESGVHRVQRVPTTESGGRIHTSTATVAVLPEAEEVDVDVNMNDIEMDVYHSSSAGGQNVQKVATAIRITHKPTGIVVTCQDEKSQLKNKLKAMGILRTRLLDEQAQKEAKEIGDQRRGQIGTGDRSEKIRTYNYPQDRVTDHRIGYTTHNLNKIMDGGLDEILDALKQASAEKALAQNQ